MTNANIFTPEEQNHIIGVKHSIQHHLAYQSMPELRANMIIAGGVIAHKLYHEGGRVINEWTNGDVDIFVLCSTEDEFHGTLDDFSRYQRNGVSSIGSLGDRWRKKSKTSYHRVMNDKILLVYDDTLTNRQFIFCKYKNRKELLEHFDYVHCMASYDIHNNSFHITRQIYDAIMNRALIENNKPSEWRRNKWMERGFTEKKTFENPCKELQIDLETDIAPWVNTTTNITVSSSGSNWILPSDQRLSISNPYDDVIKYLEKYNEEMKKKVEIEKSKETYQSFGSYIKDILNPWPTK